MASVQIRDALEAELTTKEATENSELSKGNDFIIGHSVNVITKPEAPFSKRKSDANPGQRRNYMPKSRQALCLVHTIVKKSLAPFILTKIIWGSDMSC